MFRKKSNYDKTNKIAVIRSSICTGEKVAGFKDIKTGRFDEIMLIKNEKDLKTFKKIYNVDDILREC